MHPINDPKGAAKARVSAPQPQGAGNARASVSPCRSQTVFYSLLKNLNASIKDPGGAAKARVSAPQPQGAGNARAFASAT